MTRLGLMAVAVAMAAGAAQAGTIERACLASERAAGKRSLCGCIQKAADVTLTRRDQRLAATFFADPHRAQEVRQSDRSDHESFWRKYRAFGATAERHCRLG